MELEGDADCVGRSFRVAVVNDFDVVPIGVEHEGGVIAWMIGPQARGPVVSASRGERGLVRRIDTIPISALKRDVRRPGQAAGARGGICARDDKLVSPEKPGPLAPQRNRQAREQAFVKASTGIEVPYDQLKVIDEAASKEFVGLHGR